MNLFHLGVVGFFVGAGLLTLSLASSAFVIAVSIYQKVRKKTTLGAEFSRFAVGDSKNAHKGLVGRCFGRGCCRAAVDLEFLARFLYL
ncbi:MAG: hypothetical protein V1784_09185 [bacterium]